MVHVAKTSTLCGLLGAVLISCSARAAEPDIANTDDYKWSVVLKTSKRSYKLGEPVDINLVVTNKNQNKSQYLVRHSQELVLFVSTDGKEYADVNGESGNAATGQSSKTLIKPGQKFEFERRILIRGGVDKDGIKYGGLVFGESGKYWIKAQYAGFANHDSAPIVVTVVEPERADEVAAWKIFNDPSVLLFIQMKGHVELIPAANDFFLKNNGAAKIQKLIELYPNTEYALWLNDCIGNKKGGGNEKPLPPDNQDAELIKSAQKILDLLKSDGIDPDEVDRLNHEAYKSEVRPQIVKLATDMASGRITKGEYVLGSAKVIDQFARKYAGEKK